MALFSRAELPGPRQPQGSLGMAFEHTYSNNPLDRAERERRNEAWIAAKRADLTSKILPLRNLKVLISNDDLPVLGWQTPADLEELGEVPTPLLLGLLDDQAYFAADVSSLETASQLENQKYRFEDARSAAGQVAREDAGIIAQARSHVGWHSQHGFCSVCGHTTTIQRGGQVRKCTNCAIEHFPRTDPVIIVVVSDGDQCLLGQSWGRLARSNMYSALAGFMDQGESIEEAVRREVMEEAGIQATNVRYHSSQPWPFPSSLMIGCHANAATTDIHKDDEEMTDVRWFPSDEVRSALAGKSDTLSVPGPFAIAHHLIKAWADGTIR